MNAGRDTRTDAREGPWTRLGPVADLDGEGPFGLSADGVDVVVVRTPAGLKAYGGRCPHQGALLGEGHLDGDVLVCRNHHWRFDAGTGCRDGGPERLTACPLETRGADVWADLSALPRRSGAGTTARRTLDDLPGPRDGRWWATFSNST